jgi:serine/threonine-protein kinase
MGTAILRRYVLIGAIGQGGVSTVYSAVDARHGRKLAVKVLAPTLADDPAARDDVRREALITDRLRHPSVPRVFEYGDAPLPDGTVVPYVVFELLAGVPLTDLLARGPLDWTEAVRIAATAADVLAVAHRRGVVHRDLTARNIMVTPAGIKIIDFGLATAALRSGDTGAHRTLAHAARPGARAPLPPAGSGSPRSGPPAPLMPAGFRSPRSGPPAHRRAADLPSHPKTAFARTSDDVYTLGVLLYEMLTGRSPYPPAVAATILAAGRVAHLAPTPVLAVAGLPPQVRDLVRSCMAKVPADRPASADVALALWSILDGTTLPEPSYN